MFVLYADDTSVLVRANDKIEPQTKLNFTLNKICSWFAVNGLSLNKEKTKVVKLCQSCTGACNCHYLSKCCNGFNGGCHIPRIEN
jgi:hypothetical protein